MTFFQNQKYLYARAILYRIQGKLYEGVQRVGFVTDKETDESWDIFMKNQFWAGLGSWAILVKKKVWGRL